MIGHQTVRPYLDSRFTRLLGEQIAINLVVPVLEKYSLPPVPALGHVVRKAGNHHAGKASHLGKLPQRTEKGDRYHVDASLDRLSTKLPSQGIYTRGKTHRIRKVAQSLHSPRSMNRGATTRSIRMSISCRPFRDGGYFVCPFNVFVPQWLAALDS